jgi:hypothetical protein
MATTLVSPGVQVTVIDESQYLPAATNTVPYILLATASNKVSGDGVTVAPGTLAANANRLFLATSQRALTANYGVPFFYQTTNGTPINGYELNEYGLLAAYSALGVTNQCFVQRADIDLAALTATLNRPLGTPNDGTYWLDTTNTKWGIFQWNQTTGLMTNQVPIVITNTADLETGTAVPLQTLGSIGDYAVTATDIFLPNFYKRGGPTQTQTSALALSSNYNTWVQVGSDLWKTSWATIQGVNTPTSLTQGETIVINGITVTVPANPQNTVTGLSNAINSASITGVYAANIAGALNLYCDSTAANAGATPTGGIIIANGTGTTLTTLGITAGTYQSPQFQASYNYVVPRWNSFDPTPAPTGSVWQKISNVNLGTDIVLKQYNATAGVFVIQDVPLYLSEYQALYGLDPSGGGENIPAGSTYGRVNPQNNNFSEFEVLERFTTGPTVVTGDLTLTGNPFTPGDTFIINASLVGSATVPPSVTVTIGGTGSVADFIGAVSAANVPYVSATVNSNNNIVFTHSAGGTIILNNVTGTPVTEAGFTTSTFLVRQRYVAGAPFGLTLSNFVGTPTFTYIPSDTAPDQDPVDGTYWYYSDPTQVDIMIQNNGAWVGYQTVSLDARGYNLTNCNATGPIISATPPTTQTNTAQSPLVYGDLWINTADLENYPLINRWQNVNGQDQWVLIDNANGTESSGVIFQDARWATNGTTDPVADPFPTIVSLLTSNYLDLDAPQPALYPEGILLFNTRRSGFNVKTFQVDYFNATTFPDDVLPAETNAWVSASGNKNDGSPYMGRQAQRAIIVEALKAGIDNNTQIREEYNQFTLIACPQYPELAVNMVALNNERGSTGFVIVDTPLRLTPENVVEWSNNNNGLGLLTGDGLATNDSYAGTFYPSCQTTDLGGNPVVQPPSHMMVRTIIRSDSVAYPWLAPAGIRRGVVDNAFLLGYINDVTGEFNTLGVGQGLRDVLYTHQINPITFIPGVGITNFGNKTLQSTASALDRINVARLVAFIRARLETIGKQYLFEPNDQITRSQIANACTSLMIDLVAKRGIYDYLVVCDNSNNTPARIDQNQLWVDIAIEPVKAVEFIYIPLRIENTGAIANSAAV